MLPTIRLRRLVSHPGLIAILFAGFTAIAGTGTAAATSFATTCGGP